MYTNDLVPRHHDRTSVIKYADDQTWSHMIPNHYSDDTHLEMENIYRWCVGNRMKLNLNKTKEMIVHNFRVIPTVQPLRVVSTVCVLGVNLQDNLSWSIHVEAIVKRLKQLIIFCFSVSVVFSFTARSETYVLFCHNAYASFFMSCLV